MEFADPLFESLAPDQPHRVERAAVSVFTQRVHRHDTRMLEPAGYFRLQQETGLALRILRLRFLDELECNLAVEAAVAGHENLTEPPSCQRPHDLKTRAFF